METIINKIRRGEIGEAQTELKNELSGIDFNENCPSNPTLERGLK